MAKQAVPVYLRGQKKKRTLREPPTRYLGWWWSVVWLDGQDRLVRSDLDQQEWQVVDAEEMYRLLERGRTL